MLKIAILLADVFSLAKIEAPEPLLKLLRKPNPFQTQSQFLWDYMFWIVFGNAWMLPESHTTKEQNIYWLNQAQVEIPRSTKKKLDKLIFSKSSENDLMNSVIKYRYSDNDTKNIKLKELIILNDLSNGLGNWIAGNSRLDALYKVITNSDIGLEAKRDNLDFSRKWLVNGKVDVDDVSETMMLNEEKKDIEDKLPGNKKIHAVKTPVNIQRFTDSIKKLALDESYMSDLFVIGNMYNIPKDVLEAIGSGTWDNQRVARASLVEMSLQAKGDDFVRAFAEWYGYDSDKISISWEHLSFNQFHEKERAETNEKKVNTMKTLHELGADINDLADYFGFEDIKFNGNNN